MTFPYVWTRNGETCKLNLISFTFAARRYLAESDGMQIEFVSTSTLRNPKISEVETTGKYTILRIPTCSRRNISVWAVWFPVEVEWNASWSSKVCLFFFRHLHHFLPGSQSCCLGAWPSVSRHVEFLRIPPAFNWMWALKLKLTHYTCTAPTIVV